MHNAIPTTNTQHKIRRFKHIALGVAAAITLVIAPSGQVLADTRPPSGTPATVSADSLPTVQITGIVWAQTIVGNTVYATGKFTKARPAGAAAGVSESTRQNLLAYDITTGKLLPFNHALNGTGRAITVSPDHTRLYVGGEFTTADSASHPHLAAFNLTNNTIVSTFRGGTNGVVRSLTATNSTVYAGGGFGASNAGVSRGKLIAFNSAGTLLNWKPVADLPVTAMVMSPDSTKVILGGSFAAINSSPYHSIAAVSASTGAPLSWASQSSSFPIRNEGTSSGITSLTTNGNTIFVTGYNFGGKAKPGGFEGRAAISPTNGSLIWVNDCHGDTYSAAPIGSVLYSVGHAHDCKPAGYFPETNPRTWHRALAETITASHTNGAATNGYNGFQGLPASTQLDWYPTVNTGNFSGSTQGGWSIVGNANYVSMGGEFTLVNNKPQQGLSRFAISSLVPNKAAPRAYSGFGVTAGAASASGSVAVSWRATWDQDNGTLTYRLFRDGGTTPIVTKTVNSRFWSLPKVSFTDTGRAPGSTHTYRLVVTDPFGNATQTTNR
jgi:hypothetical protein